MQFSAIVRRDQGNLDRARGAARFRCDRSSTNPLSTACGVRSCLTTRDASRSRAARARRARDQFAESAADFEEIEVKISLNVFALSAWRAPSCPGPPSRGRGGGRTCDRARRVLHREGGALLPRRPCTRHAWRDRDRRGEPGRGAEPPWPSRSTICSGPSARTIRRPCARGDSPSPWPPSHRDGSRPANR